jgi:solute carrier family 25 carnitine/acylcarnitine transporter 20/29
MSSHFNELLAGGIAGGAGIIIGQPLDTVKVRLQAEKGYNGIVNCLKKTISNEGVSGLFRGLLPPLLGATCVNAVLFYSYALSEKFLHEFQEDRLPLSSSKSAFQREDWKVFLSGSVAGASSVIVTTPIELLKCKLQVEHSVHSNHEVIFLMKKIYNRYGLLHGFFHGATVTLLRDFPSFGIYYWCYYKVKNIALQLSNSDQPKSSHLLTAGYFYKFLLLSWHRFIKYNL